MSECRLCPRNCRVERDKGQFGYCKSGNEIKIARAALHFWEEPSISGKNGSGTVFFSGCNLRCVYCQNHKISSGNAGRSVSEEGLAEVFLDLQSQGAENINLVTPTHFSVQIARSIKLAKKTGLKIPVIYNCGGYESVETIKLFDGLVDIYMPDLKYFDDTYAMRYSSAPGYFRIAKEAIAEMFKQVGKNVFDENGMMIQGVLVRHMMLPGLLFDSKKIIDFLHKEYGDDIYISIMSQYTPMPKCTQFPEINRKLPGNYYNCLVDYAVSLGVKNAYIQDGESADESFIPEFCSEF